MVKMDRPAATGNQSQQANRILLLSTSQRPYEIKFPFYEKPVELGFFSTDCNGEYRHDRSQQKYLRLPQDMNKVHFDLKQGYENMICKDDTDTGGMGDVLKWILQSSDKIAVKKQYSDAKTFDGLKTDFICWRGTLTKLLCTPYESLDDWMLAVTLFRGVWYISEFETPKKKVDRANLVGKSLEICCWGWKFEQYLTSGTSDGCPDTSVPVNNYESGYLVVRTQLGTHSIVFAGEVDAFDPQQKDSCKYVELKCTKEIRSHHQYRNFIKYKLIKFWAQSYVIGIPRIICGFRDDDGIVNSLESINMVDIPSKSKEMGYPWKGNVCFNFLDKFLEKVKETVVEDDPRTVYVFTWAPQSQIMYQKLRDSEFNFLPEWYINWERWSKI